MVVNIKELRVKKPVSYYFIPAWKEVSALLAYEPQPVSTGFSPYTSKAETSFFRVSDDLHLSDTLKTILSSSVNQMNWMLGYFHRKGICG